MNVSWVQSKNANVNKKILNLCLRWHIFKSYYFVAELTFKNNKEINEGI